MKNILNNIGRYWQTTDFGFIKKPDFIIQICGWFISYFLLLLSFEFSFSWQLLWFFIFWYFWSRVNEDVISFLKPPVEALLVLLFFLYIIFYFFFNAYIGNNPEILIPGVLPKVLVLLLVTVFGLILVMNSEKNRPDARRGILIIYTLLGILVHHFIVFEHPFYHYLFQFVLFFILLKRTIWVEHLKKKQLAVYFFILLIVYLNIRDPKGFTAFLGTERQDIFFSLLLYLHYLIKNYFLALVVKIPIVAIYNHARLSRKLWIAGLFQSTFPQIIQFLFLILIFCFFLSGWQAQDFLNSFNELRDELVSGAPPAGLSVSEQYIDSDAPNIYLENYQAVRFLPNYPDMGILAFSGPKVESVYYIYMKILNNITLVKIDQQFSRKLTDRMSAIGGSGILIYPFAPRPLMEYLYDINFWQEHNYIKIFPLGLISNNRTWSIKSIVVDKDVVRVESQQHDEDRYLVLGRVFLPIVNKNPESYTYFAFDIYHEPHTSYIDSNTTRILLGLLVIFLLLNALVIRQVGKFGAQINKIIIQKFGQLKNGIREISTGNLDYKVHLEGEDEFVEFANHFNTMSDKLKQTIEESREKERLDHELKMAREVQLSLLPKSLPEVAGYLVATSIQTATEVGGDFYDLISLSDKKIYFTIGDVSGKGSSAAFYMAQFLSLLRYSIQFTQKPDEIAIRMNSYFTQNIQDRKIFITAIIGILDTAKHTVTFVRAGHTNPILIPGNHEQKVKEINISGLAIGLTDDSTLFQKSLPVFEYKLASKDKMVFFTDGIVEATIPGGGGQYGDASLKKIISDNRDADPKSLVEIISRDLETFYKNNPRVDDHTLLIISRQA
jgi:serine phosphatase RsbU (regulator of sigma subunit)